jgi:hypothetical protein
VNSDSFDESLLQAICDLLIRTKDNCNYLFQFLNKLYDVIASKDRKDLILKYYLLPLTLYANDAVNAHYLLNIKTKQQKETLFKRFLLNFNDFFRKNHGCDSFAFGFDLNVCKCLLSNLLIAKDIKLLFLKFIENYLCACKSIDCRNLVFMYVCDYYGLENELNGCLLGIFKFYLNANKTDQVLFDRAGCRRSHLNEFPFSEVAVVDR